MSHAHFIGLCGAGMSAVAKLLLDAGWSVSGSDEGFYPPISLVIQRYGIPCATSYEAANIPEDADWIVIGKHAKLVPDTNEEVAAALESGKRVLSFPEAIAELLGARKSLVVAGSFGKSSCTALAAHVLRHAKKDPSYFIGAEALDFPDNGHHGKGNVFVLEGDEYPAANWDDRSKFLFYKASALLVTSGEHDHVNVFPTLADYLAPFEQLVASLPPDGLIVACWNGAHLVRVMKEASAPVVWYSGTDTDADWFAADLFREGGVTHFTLCNHDKQICTLTTRQLGEHSVENTVGVAALLLEQKLVTPEELAAGVAAFSGVRRRLERLNPGTEPPLYNDFGSSYAKCRAGITTILQSFPGKRVRVCFEPHTFSFRNRDALHWYDTLFAGVECVYLFQPPRHGAATHTQLTQDEIAARIEASGVAVTVISSADALLSALKADASTTADVILFETSGGFDGAIPRVAEWLRQK
nr:Mur ligase family protein [Armatimonas sp.]